jgi:hypothetical protein
MKRGEIWFYKGHSYAILFKCRMKNPITREWQTAVAYTDARGNNSVRELEEFKKKFNYVGDLPEEHKGAINEIIYTNHF